MKVLKIVFTILLIDWFIISALVLFNGNKNTVVVEQPVVNVPSEVKPKDKKEVQTKPVKVKENPPTTIPTAVPVNSCIVTIQGLKYNVFNLKRTHSGGDIFVCNTDMTSTFFSFHDNSMLQGQMQQYLL